MEYQFSRVYVILFQSVLFGYNNKHTIGQGVYTRNIVRFIKMNHCKNKFSFNFNEYVFSYNNFNIISNSHQLKKNFF